MPAAEELDAINAAMRARRNSPQVIRRTMEREIEVKATARRKEDAAAKKRRG